VSIHIWERAILDIDSIVGFSFENISHSFEDSSILLK
jgi:hypothetical protein